MKIVALLVAMSCALSGCGSYEPMTVDERREFNSDLIAAAGGYGTPKFWALWSVYSENSAEVLVVPEVDGEDGGACIVHDGSVMIARRPVRELLLLAEGELCPWDYGEGGRTEVNP